MLSKDLPWPNDTTNFYDKLTSIFKDINFSSYPNKHKFTTFDPTKEKNFVLKINLNS